MERRCFYLRKSRSDLEAEQHGDGETLLRHEKILNDTAKRMGITEINYIFREIVSGETIAARPVMQELLTQVEQGLWNDVFVVEIERLARGNSIDQGIIADTFKYSNTRIVTPNKIYDPNNEFDEEYFEFGLFMSRREYKTINRRMNQGRLSSAKEGKFVGTLAPYGYEKVKLKSEKGFTLQPIPEQANIVRLIYNLFTKGEPLEDGSIRKMGTTNIARKLNELNLHPMKSETWSAYTIKDILSNPVYKGTIRWGCRKVKKRMEDGEIKKSRPYNEEDAIFSKGLHEAIIDEYTWALAQQIKSEYPSPPVPIGKSIKNPLVGLIVCGKCNKIMKRRPYYSSKQPPTLLCSNIACDNVSSSLKVVEEKLLQAISNWIKDYKIEYDLEKQFKTQDNELFYAESIKLANMELEKLKIKEEKIYNCLEDGTYSTEVFRQRIGIVNDKKKALEDNIAELHNQLNSIRQKNKNRSEIIPKAEHLINIYYTLPDAQTKNQLLKEIVEKAVYIKTINTRWHGDPDDFKLIVFPKISEK